MSDTRTRTPEGHLPRVGAATGGAARPTVRETLRQCGTLSWRGILHTLRNPMGLTDVVIGPAIFLVLFGYVFGGAIAGDTDAYLAYIFPGTLALSTLLATTGVGASLSTDLTRGVFDRFRSLPVARLAPLVGAIGSDVVRQLVSLVALLVFGLLLGVRFPTGPVAVLAAGALAMLFAFALSWVWVLLALLLRDTQAVQGLGAVVVLPLTFVSTVFVPASSMPDWLRGVAELNPVGHLVDALRGLTAGGPVAEPLLICLAWATGLVLVFVPLTLLAYRRER